jgi:hypothetical protein
MSLFWHSQGRFATWRQANYFHFFTLVWILDFIVRHGYLRH